MVRPGMRFDPSTKELIFKEEWDNEDKEKGVGKKKRTELELKKIMNSVNPDLKFTTEIESDFETQRLPTLSFEIWSEAEGIRHSYFEKPMRSQILTSKESSM